MLAAGDLAGARLPPLGAVGGSGAAPGGSGLVCGYAVAHGHAGGRWGGSGALYELVWSRTCVHAVYRVFSRLCEILCMVALMYMCPGASRRAFVSINLIYNAKNHA